MIRSNDAIKSANATETFFGTYRHLQKDEVPTEESVLFHRVRSPVCAAHFVGARLVLWRLQAPRAHSL